MIGGLASGDSTAQVEKKLALGDLRLVRTSHESAGEGERRVEFSTAEVHEFERGTLALAFYDDRLVRIDFFPDDLASFLEAYRSSTGFDLRAGTATIGDIEVFVFDEVGMPSSVGPRVNVRGQILDLDMTSGPRNDPRPPLSLRRDDEPDEQLRPEARRLEDLRDPRPASQRAPVEPEAR